MRNHKGCNGSVSLTRQHGKGHGQWTIIIPSSYHTKCSLIKKKAETTNNAR